MLFFGQGVKNGTNTDKIKKYGLKQKKVFEKSMKVHGVIVGEWRDICDLCGNNAIFRRG